MREFVVAILVLFCFGTQQVSARSIIDDKSLKRIIIEDNRFDEQDFHWSKIPGDWMPALGAVIEDFTRHGNNLECFTVIAEGNKTEHVGGVIHKDVMFVDFVYKQDYSSDISGPAAKSRNGCGLNLHYSITKEGVILLKYKQK